MLTIRDIHVYYGKIYALKGISLEVEEKGFLTVIGANGAGKTTLLRTISGLLKPSQGSLEFLGKEISKFPAPAISRMGIAHIPEGRQLFAEMTVLENLEMGALNLKEKKAFQEKLSWIYSLFPRLAERADQIAGTLSGGEQQMLATGRGLMSNPKLLLLDEPSLGLAPLVVDHLAENITTLHKAGLSIILVEQNALLALEISEKGCVLETGNLILKGPSRELLQSEMVLKAYLGGGMEGLQGRGG